MIEYQNIIKNYSFSSWLYKIIKNGCISLINERNREMNYLKDYVMSEDINNDDIYYNLKLENKKSKMILCELNNIKHKELFIDYYICNLNIDDI